MGKFLITEPDGSTTEVDGKFVACHTAGCVNEGDPIEVPDVPGAAAVCIPCSAPLT